MLELTHLYFQAEGAAEEVVKKSGAVTRKLESRKADAKLDVHVEEQFPTGRMYAILASRPGQSGRADGYILEGRELDFYRGWTLDSILCDRHADPFSLPVRKIRTKKQG